MKCPTCNTNTTKCVYCGFALMCSCPHPCVEDNDFDYCKNCFAEGRIHKTQTGANVHVCPAHPQPK